MTSLIEPIPMRLTCLECGELHIDEGEFATKPHHTHSCQKCGLTWRPAVVYTVGVRFLPGFKNKEESVSKPKYKVGDVVTIDTGWDRQVLHKITISDVRANHGAQGAHRYWGADEHCHLHGFYETEIGMNFSGTRSDREAPL